MKGVITMKVNYNIQKEERKAMVAAVGKAVSEKTVYCGAPSFSYKVGAFEITKDGSLCFDDAFDEVTVARVRTALREAGFTSEGGENEASCADTGADEPSRTEAAVDDLTPAETAVEESDEDSLSISLPRSLFTETALQESAEKETGWCRFRDRIFLPFVIDGAIWMTGKMLERMTTPHSVK